METQDFSQQEWHEIVLQFNDLNLIQLWEYGEIKAVQQGWNVVRQIFLDGDTVIGAAQVMVKWIPLLKRGVVWINRGPLWQKRGAGELLSRLSEMLAALKRYWVDERKMYMRIAPTVAEGEDEENMIRQAGLLPIAHSQWISARIDLTQSEERLRGNLEKKWRNCLGKAEKIGLSYEVGIGSSHTEKLIKDYKELLALKEFSSVTPEFVVNLQKSLPDNRKMLILSGHFKGRHLGSILIAPYGHTVEYLVGAVGLEGRSQNAGQFLLWNAMMEMKKRGYRVFDVGGAHPEKTPKGIFHFKEGLGAVPYRLLGEFDAARGIVARGVKFMIHYRS